MCFWLSLLWCLLPLFCKIWYYRMNASFVLGNEIFWKKCDFFFVIDLFHSNVFYALAFSQGAYTGVCSNKHVPPYKENIDKFKAKGIDSVICVAINDPYTMNAWAEKLQAKDAVSYPVFLALLLKKSFMCWVFLPTMLRVRWWLVFTFCLEKQLVFLYLRCWIFVTNFLCHN